MGRRDPHIFSTLTEAVAATNPQSKLQALRFLGQGTSRDFALCVNRSISILVCCLRCISAKFRPLPLNPCTRRGLHRSLCSVYNSKRFPGIKSRPYEYIQLQNTTADRPQRRFASRTRGTSLQAIITGSDRFGPSPINLP